MAFTVIIATDAISHSPLSGASVFVNGQGAPLGGTTDSNGQFSISIIAGAPYDLTVKASNYTTYTASGLISGPTFNASLQPSSGTTQVQFSLNIVPEATANNNSITISNAGSPITFLYTAGGYINTLVSGPQTITGSVPGYQDINTAVDVSQSNSATIQLTALADTGLKQPVSQAITPTVTSQSLLPPITQQDLPEFIPPNNGQGTYFTMTQARMYIGDLFIDELNFCQFVLQNNKIPIFGYASRDFDGIAQGKSLVQGQFGINFISEGYLYVALTEYTKTAGVTISTATQQNQNQLLNLVNKLQNPDPTWTSEMLAATKTQVNQLVTALGPAGPAALQAAKAGMAVAAKNQLNALGYPGGDYSNATYNDVEFDIVIQYTGAGRTITRRLEACHLISNESIMDHSGTPIIDSYGFIARRLR